MTVITPESLSPRLAEPRRTSIARHVAFLLARIRATMGESLETTIARSVDEAFRAIHRDLRS